MTTILALLITRAFHIISPEESKVVISDTLRVIEANTRQNTEDSLLFNAITELNRTIRETTPRNNSIRVVWPEGVASPGNERQNSNNENVIRSAPIHTYGSVKSEEPVTIQENRKFTNRIVDKKGFYKQGYSISDSGVFFVLEKKPNVSDKYLTFELRLIQPADLLSHIYLTICDINEDGKLYQFFGQTYEVREDLNIIKIANNLHEGKNRIEIGVFQKSDEGKDFPTFYRNIFTLVK